MRNVALFALVVMLIAVPGSYAEKVPDLGKTKFKDIAKYLDLTPGQQARVKPDVERIQQIVKDAQNQPGSSGGFGSGGRAPVGGTGAFGRPSPGGMSGATEVPSSEKIEERRAMRKEWQTEINNRVDEIKTFLTPAQLGKFKAIQVPNLFASKSW